MQPGQTRGQAEAGRRSYRVHVRGEEELVAHAGGIEEVAGREVGRCRECRKKVQGHNNSWRRNVRTKETTEYSVVCFWAAFQTCMRYSSTSTSTP